MSICETYRYADPSSHPQLVERVIFEEGAVPDVPPEHEQTLVPCLILDLSLTGPGHRGRGREPSSKRVPGEIPRINSGREERPFYDERHYPVDEPRRAHVAVTIHGPEEGAIRKPA